MTESTIDHRYLNSALPVKERARLLVSQMTLREKIAQMLHQAPPIPRLNVPAYGWWSECLHGVGRAGKATVFPQCTGLAATFHDGLVYDIADAISTEARAKHHDAVRRGFRGQCAGLTFWTPNINIFRDPRWGRGQETYGEDPYLTARMGVAFVKGLQGDDPRHLKVAACAKHYAVHSGPESGRHSFDSVVNSRDLHETYLPAFRACVTEAKVESVMTAYNRTNGEACSASPTLLGRILRGDWQFDGHVLSDCGAVEDICNHHKLAATPAEAAAMAVREGCDLCCGEIYRNLLEAVQRGLVTEAAIDRSVCRLFTTRMRLGMFDPPAEVKWASISPEVVCCPKHADLALQAARESLVLLKNDGILPLDADKLKCLGVSGPLALDLDVLLGNYNGHSRDMVSYLAGIVDRAGAGTSVPYNKGCDLVRGGPVNTGSLTWWFAETEAIVVCLGNTAQLEGEEGDAYNAEAGGDRISIGLPGRQQELLEVLVGLKRPVILVVSGGGAIDLSWAHEHCAAIVFAWYPGQAGGTALAEVLFGDYNPAGRLPVTFPRSVTDLPHFHSYAMAGRTYRYAQTAPLYPFGFGLSYTTFDYAGLALSSDTIGAEDRLTARVKVRNTGTRDGDEVVQLYIEPLATGVPAPRLHLESFRRIHLAAGEETEVVFNLQADQFRHYRDDGLPFFEPGPFRIHVGGGQPGYAPAVPGHSNSLKDCGGADTSAPVLSASCILR